MGVVPVDNKAAAGFCSNPTKLDNPWTPDLSGKRYLGTRATHIDGELEGIALALDAHEQTGMLAILSDCRPAIRVTENLDTGTQGPRSHIEARIQSAPETRENQQQETRSKDTRTLKATKERTHCVNRPPY